MRRAVLVGCFAVFGVASPAAAHPLRFGTLLVEEHAPGEATARLRFSGSERRPDAADIVLPDTCVDLAPPTATPIPYGVARERRVRCRPGALARGPVGVRGIGEGGAGDSAQVMLHLSPAGEPAIEVVLDAAVPLFRSSAAPAPSRGTVARYGALGVEHILLGYDHLLFLVVLLLVIRRRRPLLLAITAFTLGHSLTLALAVLDVVRAPAAAVEAAIALSIAVVAAEVVRRRRTPRDDLASPSLGSAALVPAAFGLVHGLGFAGALRDIGVPADRLLPALVSFNLGVEFGQLLFVAAAVAATLLARRLASPSDRASRTAALFTAYAAGIAGAWLCIERLVG